MNKIELQVNGKTLIFTNESVSYASHKFYYAKMSNIAHRGGEQPAYIFDYDGKRLALPYNPKDKEIMLKLFQHIVALNRQNQTKAVQPEPVKETATAHTANNNNPDDFEEIRSKYKPPAKIAGIALIVIGLIGAITLLFSKNPDVWFYVVVLVIGIVFFIIWKRTPEEVYRQKSEQWARKKVTKRNAVHAAEVEKQQKKDEREEQRRVNQEEREKQLAEERERRLAAATERYRQESEERVYQERMNSVVRCPKCGCSDLSADKKGFGIGKAVVGNAVAGPIGLVAGNAGAKKIRITCLNCGHQWWAGKRK